MNTFPPWTVSILNNLKNEQVPTLDLYVTWTDFHDEQIPTISITWKNFNYEQIPTLNGFHLTQFSSSNKFENERIPTLNIF
jgi:hypothetical protein